MDGRGIVSLLPHRCHATAQGRLRHADGAGGRDSKALERPQPAEVVWGRVTEARVRQVIPRRGLCLRMAAREASDQSPQQRPTSRAAVVHTEDPKLWEREGPAAPVCAGHRNNTYIYSGGESFDISVCRHRTQATAPTT